MKGQYFSFDAIVAAVIFVLALVALLSYWHSVRSFLDYQNDPLSKESIRVSNLLFMPSSPPSVSCGSMETFGLTVDWNDRRVNSSVVDCAALQDQQWLRNHTRTPYGVVINVTNLEDNSVINIGGDVNSSSINVVKIRRLATVVNSTGSTYLATVDLTMYR